MYTDEHKATFSKIAYENAFDHIIVTDAKGILLYMNPAAEKLTGYSQAEAVGQTPKLWGGQMKPEFYQHFWQVVSEEKQPYVGELINKNKAGQLYNAEIRVTPVFDPNGTVTHYIGIERDITQAKRIDQMKTDFLSLVSHQLRTPIGQLNAYMDNILSGIVGEFTPDQQEYMDGMKRSITRCRKLVNNMLNVSRIERGVIQTQLEDTDLEPIISNLIQEFQPDAAKKQLSLTYQPQSCLVHADADKLYEVISNIIDNAIKYTQAGGLTITTQVEDGQVVIKLADTGPGMAPELIDSLFHRDKILTQPPTANEGARLGMYLAKMFMQLQHGAIEVESSLGQGTTFILRLPIAKGEHV